MKTLNGKTWLIAGVLAGGALLARGVASNAGENPQNLRAAGPVGLEKFWTAHQAEINARVARLRAGETKDDAAWQQLSARLDAVAGQRDAWSSRLYWFTDMDAAKAAAHAQNKPILSLRMLGRLTDEYSCANSRFFRTALYSNAKISQTLRDKFILHWSMERPVPVVTIDMGDGRVVKRTLTGNSAHYLLDAQGRPLDALPGLYGPGAFEAWLERGAKLQKESANLEDTQRREKIVAFHEAQLGRIADEYINDQKASSPGWKAPVDYRATLIKQLKSNAILVAPAAPAVDAPAAGRLAVSKMIAEFPILNATELYRLDSRFPRNQVAYWTGLTPHLEQARLDENSRLLFRSQRHPVDNAPVAANPQM
jgi:hypothetical protein